MTIPTPAPVRFWAKVAKAGPDECWLWTAATNACGYGTFSPADGRRSCLAHRFAYEDAVGVIPEGLTIDHLCRVRNCVNPSHLEPVSLKENVLRSPIQVAGAYAARTHCKHGHEFTPENTYRSPMLPGARRCRICIAAGTKRWRDKKRS